PTHTVAYGVFDERIRRFACGGVIGERRPSLVQLAMELRDLALCLRCERSHVVGCRNLELELDVPLLCSTGPRDRCSELSTELGEIAIELALAIGECDRRRALGGELATDRLHCRLTGFLVPSQLGV